MEDQEASVMCDSRDSSGCSLLGVTLFSAVRQTLQEQLLHLAFLESCGLEAASHGGGFFLNEEGRKSTIFIYTGFSQRELNRKVSGLNKGREILSLDRGLSVCYLVM